MTSSQKFALILGGAGNLGRATINTFATSWKVASIDLKINEIAHLNYQILTQHKITDQLESIYNKLNQFSKNKYDAIICVAGGFTMDRIKTQQIFENYEKMMNCNIIPSLLAAHLATRFLNENGLLVFTAASKPFKEPCSDMVSYALSKQAVQSIAHNMATCPDLINATVLTILPEVLDTPENREAMPKEDFTKWTNPSQLSGILKLWADGYNRPKNGSFAIIKNINGSAIPEFQ